jgi:hypothetical protein
MIIIPIIPTANGIANTEQERLGHCTTPVRQVNSELEVINVKVHFILMAMLVLRENL